MATITAPHHTHNQRIHIRTVTTLVLAVSVVLLCATCPDDNNTSGRLTCADYHKLDNDNNCVATVYRCDNGIIDTSYSNTTPMAQNEMVTAVDVQRCISCDSGYTVISGECFVDNQFSRHHNTVTIVCPGVTNNSSGTVDGQTYTKRDNSTITAANATTSCTTGISDMSSLFNDSSFDDDISHWDVSSVTDMNNMFNGADAFDQDIGSWNVENVNTMAGMFANTDVFDQDIGGWDVSNVFDMNDMLFNAESFNQDIGQWDVSNVVDMDDMFNGAGVFNHDISEWDVSRVIDMRGMFNDADAFNQDIGGWNVGNVVSMSYMFNDADVFDQDLSRWCVQDYFADEPPHFDTNTLSSWMDDEKPDWDAASCPTP